jgi:hypothetical protein
MKYTTKMKSLFISHLTSELPDDHPCVYYPAFVDMIHFSITQGINNLEGVNRFIRSAATDFPWIDDVRDTHNMKIPTRDFIIDFTFVVDNLDRIVPLSDDEFEIIMNFKDLLSGYSSFCQNVTYRYDLMSYVFRMAYFDHGEYYEPIIDFIHWLRSNFLFLNPLRILEIEVRIFEHFAMFPDTIDYLLNFFVEYPQTIMAIASAVNSDWHIWDFPPYKEADRCVLYLDMSLSVDDPEYPDFAEVYDYLLTLEEVSVVNDRIYVNGSYLFNLLSTYEDDPYIVLPNDYLVSYEFYETDRFNFADREVGWILNYDFDIDYLDGRNEFFREESISATPQMYFPVVSDVTSSIDGVRDSIDDFTDKLPDKEERLDWKKTFESLGASLDSTSSVFSAFSSLSSLIPGAARAKNASDKMKEAFNNVASKDQSDTLFMCMFASFIYYLRYRTWMGVSLFAIFWLPMCLYDSRLFKITSVVWLYIATNLPTVEDIDEDSVIAEPQMSQDQMDSSVELISTLFLGYLSVNKTRDTETAIVHFLKDFSRVKGGAVDVAKVTFKFAENLINVCLQQASSLNPTFRFFSTNHTLYDEYFLTVREFCSKYNNHQIQASAETLCSIAALIEAGRKIKLGLPKDNTSKEISEFLTQDLSSLRKIQTSLEHQNISFTGFRQEPVVVEFKGPTSVGKSVVQTNANYAAVARHFSGKELEDFKRQPSTKVYTCVPENEYMDGFRQSHWVVNIDDFGQGRDVVGSLDNEYMKLIRFVNGFEYYPHMAEIENKGTVTFKAPYIFLSTNVRDHNPVSLALPKAFKRRIHFSYIVVPKLAHCTEASRSLDLWHRVLDPNSLPTDQETGVTVLDDIVHEYHVLDNQTSTPTGEIITFAEVMQRCFDKYDSNQKYFEQNLNTFNSTIDKYHDLYHPNIPIEDEIACDMEVIEEIAPVSSIFGIGSYQQVIADNLTHRRARTLITHYCPQLDYDPVELLKQLHMIEILLLDASIDEVEFRRRVFDASVQLVPFYSMVKFRKKFSFMAILKDIWNKISPTLMRLLNFLRDHGVDIVIMLIGFSIQVGILYLIQKFLAKLFCSRETYDQMYPQSHNEGDKMRVKKGSPRLYKNPTKLHEFVKANPGTTPQMGADSNGQDILLSIMKTNHFTLSKKSITEKIDENGNTTLINNWDHLGHFIVWRDRVAQMPFHYLITMTKDLQDDVDRLNLVLKIERNGKSKSPVVYEFTLREFLLGFKDQSITFDGKEFKSTLLPKDQMMIELPDIVQPCKDITSYIVSEKSLRQDINLFDAMLVNGKSYFFCYASYQDRPCPVIDKQNDEQWFLRDYYRYHAVTVNGDCGTIFGKLDASVPKEKIYGMHVSGGIGTNYGFAVAFTREEVVDTLDKLYPRSYDLEPQIDWTLPTNFIIEGPIANPPVLPTKSSICKSPIYDLVTQHTTTPCKLFAFQKDGIEIDPWEKALLKYDKPPKIFTEVVQKQVQRAADQYFSMLHDTMIIRYSSRVFTLEEAIHGVLGDPHFGPIPSSTSAGYPMNVQGTENLKKLLFAEDRDSEEYLKIYERIADEIELAEVTYANGGRPEFYYVDYLKDERKPTVKALAGKTRMFSGGPLILFLLFRKHFGWFDSHYKSNKIRNWSAIGVNPFSTEWDHIARFLGEITLEEILAGAGDYAGFDTDHCPFIHLIIVSLIIKVYYPNATPREISIKLGLWQEIYASNHIFMGIVIRWFHGMPSGNALTAIINTIYNAICLCFVFICVIDENPHLNLTDEDCTKSLRAAILGDDNVFTTIPLLIPYYNEITLPKYLARVGMTYTTELKETAIIPFRPLTEVSFLKRAWTYCPMSGRFIAPLELSVVLEFSMWSKKGKDFINIAASNLENSLRELSLHPEEVWNKYYPIFLAAAKQEYPQYPWVHSLLMPWAIRRQKVLETISFF